jgi:uncharacterized protein YbjT (DUF2867 family)
MTLTRRLVAIFVAALIASACTTPADDGPRTVLVAGATGKTGRIVVTRLVDEGYVVRALVRDTAKAEGIVRSDGVTLFQGDIKDPAGLAEPLAGVDAVISAVGASSGKGPDRPEMIDFEGVRNLVDAARSAGVQQFVLVSSRSVTQPDHPLNKMFGDVLRWKLQGENALRASGIPYTIIRPGGLLNGPGGESTIVFEQGDTATAQTTITRADVAELCVQALKFPEARNRTFETHAVAGPPTSDFRAGFASLGPDD